MIMVINPVTARVMVKAMEIPIPAIAIIVVPVRIPEMNLDRARVMVKAMGKIPAIARIPVPARVTMAPARVTARIPEMIMVINLDPVTIRMPEMKIPVPAKVKIPVTTSLDRVKVTMVPARARPLVTTSLVKVPRPVDVVVAPVAPTDNT